MNAHKMTPSKINKEFAKLDKLDSQLCDEFIACGRGHETSFQIMRQTDPMALRYVELMNRRMDLVNYCQQQWGMNRPPVR